MIYNGIVISKDEAEKLVSFIYNITTKGQFKSARDKYNKLMKMGILEIYDNLRNILKQDEGEE